jgi:hypothetical protein
MLGGNTFRDATSTMSRSALYAKNGGEVDDGRAGLRVIQSPLSGSTLVTTAFGRATAVKDPITGTVLSVIGAHAHITAPLQKQPQVHSRMFYLQRDVEVTIQQLRSTNKVNKFTNEKIGTSGTATGLDASLNAH